MSRNIGTNTEPLKVETYIENGLIKGRIVIDDHIQYTSNEPISVIIQNNEQEINEEHIVEKLCKNIYLFECSNLPYYNYKTLEYFDHNSLNIDNHYETFDYINYCKQNNISMSRHETWNHYQQSNMPFIIDNLDMERTNNGIMIDIINDAIDHDYDEILIVVNNGKYISNNIKKYMNDIKNDVYELITAKMIISGPINNIKSLIIRKAYYNDIKSLLTQYNKTWNMSLVVFSELNFFETVFLDDPLFE